MQSTSKSKSKSKSNRRKLKSFKFVPRPKQQWNAKQHKRNWLELPYDVTANILHIIGGRDVLENAQKVCTTWHKICKDPVMWRVIYMDYNFPYHPNARHRLREMCKHAVDRSQGQLVDITMVDFADDELLEYIADRASGLRRLVIACSYGDIRRSCSKALKKFPLLEELGFYTTVVPKESIVTAGRYYPMLRTLKINQEAGFFWHGFDGQEGLTIPNEILIAIGVHLHELRHLELIGMNISNHELRVILAGCSHLESLDLRQCLYVNLEGEFGKKCLENIKCLKLPNDSYEGSPYNHATCEDGVVYDFGTEPETFDFDDITVPHNFGVHDDDNIEDLELLLF